MRIYLRVKAAQVLADDVSGRRHLTAGLHEFVYLGFYFKNLYMFCRLTVETKSFRFSPVYAGYFGIKHITALMRF
jgi:hypothetical protein